MKALVYNNTTPAGILEKTTDGFVFTYLNEYYNDATKHAISLSFPKTQTQYTSKYMFPFFSGLLTEGFNKQVQCRTLKIDEEADFTRLIKTANTETIGAITIKQML